MIVIVTLAILGLLTVLAFVAMVRAPGKSKPVEGETRYEKADRERGEPDVSPKLVAGTVFGILAAILGLFLLLQSFHIVKANETGVPVTLGKVGSGIGSGPTLTAPWTDIETLPTRPQTVTVDSRIRTAESGQVGVKVSGRWATTKDLAPELFRQVRTGDDDKIQRDIITPQVQGAVNEFYGGLTNVNAIDGKQWSTNATGVSKLATERLARYGILLVDVQIRDVNPDKATNEALARIAAQQRETAVANEANQTAIKQATRNLTEARGLKDAADALKDLTPAQVELLRLQAGERIMNKNAEKGIPTYTLPGQDGGSSVIAK
jgi:regulator of protease activity HflC (stomatin/prohibitin superfamily)